MISVKSIDRYIHTRRKLFEMWNLLLLFFTHAANCVELLMSTRGPDAEFFPVSDDSLEVAAGETSLHHISFIP